MNKAKALRAGAYVFIVLSRVLAYIGLFLCIYIIWHFLHKFW